MLRRERGLAQALRDPLMRKIKESRVLLIGAGGIGCELLKNLVCSGFGTGIEPASQTSPNSKPATIVVIDLDTIDVSNLNRQFLFRKQHIKKPKAFVAKDTASQFNPHSNIEAHHASIFDNEFDVSFFESFDLVFNALDNLAARRHVNRMCLAANVPLIESGTTGFNGQVQAIKKGVTECYDCNEKPVQKSFPICTIRSTPSQPIHCIVWAKSYLFPELFGTSEEDSADVTVTETDNAEEVAKLREEAQALKKIKSVMGSSDFAQAVFDKVFYGDIERLRSMPEMWKGKRRPEPLKFEIMKGDADLVKKGQALATKDQQSWSLEENLAVFCYSLDTLSSRTQGGETVIEFDKDDKDTLDFVASAANLRSFVFGIPLNSEWEIKQMAGNIIPAIATSNALTAGLCILESYKILRSTLPEFHSSHNHATTNGSAPKKPNHTGAVPKNHDGPLGGAKWVFLASKNVERMLMSQALATPKPDCPVCSPAYAKLCVPSTGSQTLQDLVNLIQHKTGFEDFSITTDLGMIYDPDLEDNLSKPLAEIDIRTGSNSFITITDGADDPKVDLMLSVRGLDHPDLDDLELQPSDLNLPLKPKASESMEAPLANGTGNLSVSELAIGNKRKRGAEDDIEQEDASNKKAKSGNANETIVVEDDGAILLDD
ncbi:hypothetical protein K431DRAFT_273281 [Polychaeton citri CBS 116435]|uniref:Ubiquitin-activating enzyme E1-like n=1 Tax=Polychaeton citri CBS 116435 TaxID=1314669 RepID=A0A9P4Q4D5_9PEZI|nr:hypothetical protein K431DRAFT_273281 [Polychaeton citri CBS 116435]